MGGIQPQGSLTTKSNGGRPLPVRDEAPLVAQQVLDAPQAHHLQQQPSPLSLPHYHLPHQQVTQRQGKVKFQVPSLQPDVRGNPNNSKGTLTTQDNANSWGKADVARDPNKSMGTFKDKAKAQVSLSQGYPKVQDLGPDWQQEFRHLNNQGQGTSGSVTSQVAGEFSSVTTSAQQIGPQTSSTVNGSCSSLQQQPQVQHDSKGRELAPCGCLKRTPPPPPPNEPPCDITPENAYVIKNWFLEKYASSSFNTCPHQPLPLMTGLPPLRIHVKSGTEPVAIHRPSTIPAHWVEQVRRELEQDIDLGVLERGPSNTPTTWCSRMHVVGKKSGDPR